MPISSYAVIPDVANKLIIQEPKTVLDVGIGNGLYGCLVKNYLPDAHVTGIEGWEAYRNPMWQNYDSVIVHEVPQALEYLKGKFDAIIMCDVIEHFDPDKGDYIIERLKGFLKKGGIMIVTTPSIFCEQGAVNGNHLEIHRSLWKDINGFKRLREEGPDKYGHYMQVFFHEKK